MPCGGPKGAILDHVAFSHPYFSSYAVLPALVALGVACSNAPSHDSAPNDPNTVGGKADNGNDGGQAETVSIIILHTSDEHGWLDAYAPEGATKVRGGVANLLGLWRAEEHLLDGSHVVLSGGDNLSGPAVSTWFRGEPAVEAMNLVGYQASVIGNHEFDFGVDGLRDRITQARCPYLGANIIDESTGAIADFALPHVMIPHRGVNVGVIGVTTPDTATDAHPLKIAGLRFEDIATTLKEHVPVVRDEGADVVVVLAHACCPELEDAAEGLGVDVDLMFGAHCHRRSRTEVEGIPIICSGSYWRYYSRVELTYNRVSGEVESYEASVPEVAYEIDDEPIAADPELQLVVDGWTQRAREELGAPVGYGTAEIENASWTMANWITDSWLWAFPEADIAIEIFGGMRQSIPAGSFTEYEVVGMLPFDNVIYQVELTGAQVIANLDRATTDCQFRTACYPAVAGIRYVRDNDVFRVTLPDGTPLDPEGMYRVLVNDFLYYGGVNYDLMDHEAPIVDTGTFTRQPVMEYTRALETSAGNPLESLLDAAPRDR